MGQRGDREKKIGLTRGMEEGKRNHSRKIVRKKTEKKKRIEKESGSEMDQRGEGEEENSINQRNGSRKEKAVGGWWK